MSKYPNTPQAAAQALIDRFGGCEGVVPSNTYASIAEAVSRLPDGSGGGGTHRFSVSCYEFVPITSRGISGINSFRHNASGGYFPVVDGQIPRFNGRIASLEGNFEIIGDASSNSYSLFQCEVLLFI